ncbi:MULTISPECIES: DUF1722 domain-containing protein [Staphylococcus]|uniref:DUF1722 domain-containing protein n=1 Tax=Staphylococcus agnetis TaxID=985762 RepID=A0A242VJ80_9STAP|nr:MULTISPECIES: DUF1722 domain-containing protein [Staphylococcus]ALN75888.1 YbgA family protein [Staphylococcus agnetis]MBY7664837.1 YbgA family protein [Staphylococcus agnetis]MCO4327331.1 YbgA family protein [Staphylococcus agnetis]MCO4358220.1 YbgA family protein [Staphylococcus agnetis]MCO4362332.1 YbgA family protein [Staphylococcus agnetis]
MKEITKIQKLWQYEKYHVMMHNYNNYTEIKTMIKLGHSYDAIKTRIDEILNTPIQRSAFLNTFQHLWGYFKKYATQNEKALYTTFVNQLQTTSPSYDTCIQFIQHLAIKYDEQYLLNSSIMTLSFHKTI